MSVRVVVYSGNRGFGFGPVQILLSILGIMLGGAVIGKKVERIYEDRDFTDEWLASLTEDELKFIIREQKAAIRIRRKMIRLERKIAKSRELQRVC